MGQMCCTKYGEDGQSALILDKSKKPENKKTNKRNNRDIVNHTTDLASDNEFNFPIDAVKDRTRNNNLPREGSGNSCYLPNNPMNTQMGDEMD